MTADKIPEGAQDEALRLADALDGGKLIDDSTEWADTLHASATELRRLHARVQELERAVADEREDCAQVCERIKTNAPTDPDDVERGFNVALRRAAAAIRARDAQGESNAR